MSCIQHRWGQERSVPGRRLQINLANALWSCGEGKNQLSRKQRPGLPCLLCSLLVWTVEGGSEEAQNKAYSNELESIINQRMLARRAQDIVPATFFSAVEFLLTNDMALLARVSPCLSNQSWEVEGRQHR